MLGSRITGGGGGIDYPMAGDATMHHEMTLLMLGRFLISPSMWLGLAVAAAFLAGAVRVRRYQGPI
jgi:hypothetical protein